MKICFLVNYTQYCLSNKFFMIICYHPNCNENLTIYQNSNYSKVKPYKLNYLNSKCCITKPGLPETITVVKHKILGSKFNNVWVTNHLRVPSYLRSSDID